MRRLTPGDVSAKLDRIAKSTRGRRWRKKARCHLLRDAGADPTSKARLITLKDGETVCTKRRFSTREDAELAMGIIKQSPNRHRHESRCYFCRQCGAYHLTSMEYRPHGREEHDHQDHQPPGQEEHGERGRGKADADADAGAQQSAGHQPHRRSQ